MPTVRRFLVHQFGPATINPALLTPEKVASFLATELRRSRNRHTQKSACSAIRMLFRFMQLRYALPAGMDRLVPRLPHWRQSPIPQSLSQEQLAALQSACAGDQPANVRQQSLFLLFTRLGMRTAEVAGLSIDDIDWLRGCIMIRGGKNRRDRSLPLPVDVGVSLVAHLQTPRPADAPRFVFLASRGPYSPDQNYNRIRAEIRKLLRKAGISGVRLGAHVLRHTVASNMVKRGASFKEVADVLGHECLQTSAIYAKLDLATLASVALPWTGGDHE